MMPDKIETCDLWCHTLEVCFDTSLKPFLDLGHVFQRQTFSLMQLVA